MKRYDYLEICDNFLKEKAEKIEKKAIVTVIVAGIMTAIVTLIIAFSRV